MGLPLSALPGKKSLNADGGGKIVMEGINEMIKVEHVSKKFVRNKDKKTREEFFADKDMTFEAKDGEIVGILGPNGAGKTTLLRMIAGILEPTEGSISFDGLSYRDSEIEIKQKIAYLSGNTRLYDRRE